MGKNGYENRRQSNGLKGARHEYALKIFSCFEKGVSWPREKIHRARINEWLNEAFALFEESVGGCQWEDGW
jgi:hypothetical protein